MASPKRGHVCKATVKNSKTRLVPGIKGRFVCKTKTLHSAERARTRARTHTALCTHTPGQESTLKKPFTSIPFCLRSVFLFPHFSRVMVVFHLTLWFLLKVCDWLFSETETGRKGKLRTGLFKMKAINNLAFHTALFTKTLNSGFRATTCWWHY